MSLFRRRSRAVPPAPGAGPVRAVDFAGDNRLLVEWRDGVGTLSTDEVDALTERFAFAIPTDLALAVISEHSPRGVVELGAGTGFWAHLLHSAGVDVVAYDRAPPGSPDNRWFHSSAAWFPVATGDETVVDRHSDRTLLIVWPTRNEVWAADALDRYAAAGGTTVVYVGEGPGRRTGDARFHALLGESDGCLACRYGVLDVACTCGIDAMWMEVDHVVLPHWSGHDDDLHVHRRRPLVSPP
jgi:hypothetical protein